MPDRRKHAPRGETGAALGAPPGLEVYRARRGDVELLVLEWPIEARDPERALGQVEREVLALALAGLSSARIAARRGRSRRTVENQLASICAKVGVRGRLELFARFARPPPGDDR